MEPTQKHNVYPNDNFLVNWVPDFYKERVNILWTAELGVPTNGKKNVWFEHGIPDTHIDRQLEGIDYYLCACRATHDFLQSKGKRSFFTGSIFEDKVAPIHKLPRFLVYVPIHCSHGTHGLDINNDPPEFSPEFLQRLTEQYECESYFCSIIEDTEIDRYSKHDLYFSSRHEPENFLKNIKHLYETAKVIFCPHQSTFDTVAEAYGIPVIGREYMRKRNILKESGYSASEQVYVDGKNEQRILSALDQIISEL